MGLEPLWSKEGNLVHFTDVIIIFVSHLTTGSGSEFCSSSCASPGLAHVQHDHVLFLMLEFLVSNNSIWLKVENKIKLIME